MRYVLDKGIVKKLKRTNKILFSWIAVAVVAFNGLAMATPLFLTSTAHASPYYVANCSFDKSGNTWTLQHSCTSSTKEINIPANVTVNGNGYTIASNFTKTSNSNNAALGIMGNNVTVENLTIDGTRGTSLHGINVYESTDVVLDNVTLENNAYDGLVVNGSDVTVNNLTTMNNGWGGVDVDLGSGVPGPAKLTVNGTSNQYGETCAIVVDDINKAVSVVDTNNQYVRVLNGNTACYRQAPTVPTNGQPNGVFKTSNVFNYTWDASTDGSQPLTYEFRASKSSHTTNGVLDTNVWDNVTNHVNSSQYPLTSPSIPSVGTPDGVHYWQVRACDSSNNCSAWSQVWSYTLDSHPPTGLANLSPSNPTYTTTANQQKITWTTASDPDGPVTYYYESSHSNTTNPNGSFTNPAYGPVSTGSNTYIDTPGTPQGTYYWNVKACDSLGNCTNWTNPWRIVVDNTPPVVNITYPSNGALLSYTKDGTVAIKGSVTDTNPDHYYWRITGPGGYSKSQTVYDYSSFTNQTITNWDLNGLASGTYAIDLEARDAAGNKDAGSVQTIQVTVDNTAPSVPTASFTANNSGNPVGNGDYTNSKDFTFGLFNPSSDGVVRYQLKYWNNIPSSSFDSSHPWSPTNLSTAGHMSTLGVYTDNFTQGEGTHYFEFSACDAADNCSPFSSPFVINYDSTPPSAPGTPTTTSPTNNDTVNWTWTAANDNAGTVNSGIDHYVYWLTDSSNNMVGSKQTTSSLIAITNVTNDGVYTMHVEAVDGAGNTGPQATGSVTVDTTPPQITINTLSTTNTTPTITGSVNEPVSSVSVTVSGHTYIATVTGTNWSAQVTNPLSIGSYNVIVTATDLAGNTNNITTLGYLTITTSPSAITHNALTTTTNNANGNNGGTGGQVLGTSTNNSGNGGSSSDGSNDGHVLGAQTNTPSNNNSSNNNKSVKTVARTSSNRFLGLGWWWLPIVIVVLFLLWLLARRRGSSDEA